MIHEAKKGFFENKSEALIFHITMNMSEVSHIS